jgi:short subunit dehydrogenase-like uncharacterized protein
MPSPSYDLIVFGAAGFVGRILSKYLLEIFGFDGELRWAAAGRSEEKTQESQKTRWDSGPKIFPSFRPMPSIWIL